jgi:CheY-like chemotaxis protein
MDQKPVALIVEDKPRALSKRRELFDLSGFMAIEASSLEQALLQLESVPAIDIIVTDIDLDSSKAGDRSGLDLASEVRQRRPGMPIVGYSGMFSEGDLSEHEWAHFDRHLAKGMSGIQATNKRLAEWRELALTYRRRRLTVAAAELDRIKKKYRLLNKDFDVLRDFLPGSHLPSGAAIDLDIEYSPDEVISRLGYRLTIVEAGVDRPVNSAGANAKTRSSILAWVKEEDQETTVAELYGHPSIYEYGDSEKEAINRLLLLMDGFYADFCSDPQPSLSLELTELRDYLRNVFG